MQTNVVTTGPTLTYSRDYAEMLSGMGLNFAVVNEQYLQVGEPKKVQGWLLHLSSIKTQVQRLMEVVLPLLTEEKVPFKIVKDYRAVKDSLEGLLGYHQLGKIITIYYEDDSSLISFTKVLIEATKEFRGPAIPTDAHLGSIVYTRYGGMDPVLQIDTTGCTGKYIYNEKGELEMETYNIPFLLPKNVLWPFQEVVAPPNEKGKKLLYNNYLITSLLKHDVKGDVFKALRVKKFYPEWCIIKEGHRDMWSDDWGRDVQERIRWQYKIQKDLYGHVSVPEPYELFEAEESTYIAMQYVKGRSLHDIIHKAYDGKSWPQLEKNQKLLLLGYLLQIISQCEALHKKGYVHRDLALPNFIVTKKNKLVLIDMELAYSLDYKTPHPPFRLGTPGFMSPEQIKTITPTVKEDIYALGAVMIELFTSLHPGKFSTYDLHELKENMLFHIGHNGIADIIVQCMNGKPLERPVLSLVQKTIEQYRLGLTEEKSESRLYVKKQPRKEHVRQVLEQSLHGMCDMILENPIKTRYKEIEGQSTPESNLSLGWYAGLSGILYVLTQAGQCVPGGKLKEAYVKGCAFIEQKLVAEKKTITPGLYMGAAGVATAISGGLKNNWLLSAPKWEAELLQLLQIGPVRLDMAHGIAGQGTATLQTLPYLPQDLAQTLLQQHVETLLNAQQDDGGWITDEHAKLKSSSFSLGSTGILFFLLECAGFSSKDSQISNAILKGMNWLRNPAKTAGNYTWLSKNKYKTINLGLDGDIAGTALCFIKAYTTSKNPEYRTCAEEVLRNIPGYLVGNEMSTAIGLPGLGHVYLEAAIAFDSEEWMHRASWIANLIANASYLENRNLRYWVTTHHVPPSMDLMLGSSGIVHFLLRYLHPRKIPLVVSGATINN